MWMSGVGNLCTYAHYRASLLNFKFKLPIIKKHLILTNNDLKIEVSGTAFELEVSKTYGFNNLVAQNIRDIRRTGELLSAEV